MLLDQGSWFVEQIDCERNLYGSRWRLDFYLFHPDKFPNGLVIESKWQGSPGSVDEKYVFTVLSLKSLSTPSMLVLGGGGARRGAVDWIRKQIGKNFKTTDQFIDWGNKNL